jgi:hypothetical protein
VFFEQSFELFSPRRIYVDLSRDIVTGSNQLARRIEPMYTRKGWIRDQVNTVGSRLKNSLTDLFEDPAVLSLSRLSSFFLLE